MGLLDGCNGHFSFGTIRWRYSIAPYAGCEAYRALFRMDLDAEVLGKIRDNLNQCRALGSERFKDEIEAAWAERYVPARPGDRGRRPKKARLISWKW
jgi:hypothetical protein